MSWHVVVEYASGEKMIFNGVDEPEEVVAEALDVCEAALEAGVAVRLVMTYQEGA